MENGNEEKSEDKKKISIKLKNIIIISIIVAVAIIGIIIYSVYNKNKCTETYKNNSTESSIPFGFGHGIDKPIIYLYPEEKTEVSVKLLNDRNLTCSYPKYNGEWKVLAKPNGELKDLLTSRNLYSLYYESLSEIDFKIEKDGFIVENKDVAKFLEEKLELLGLTERESEEFIVYWLPKLEANKYNYIRFATEGEINTNMPLEINPNPNTIIRILMTFKGLNEPIEVSEQKLETPERKGFVAVEWGWNRNQVKYRK